MNLETIIETDLKEISQIGIIEEDFANLYNLNSSKFILNKVLRNIYILLNSRNKYGW